MILGAITPSESEENIQAMNALLAHKMLLCAYRKKVVKMLESCTVYRTYPAPIKGKTAEFRENNLKITTIKVVMETTTGIISVVLSFAVNCCLFAKRISASANLGAALVQSL